MSSSTPVQPPQRSLKLGLSIELWLALVEVRWGSVERGRGDRGLLVFGLGLFIFSHPNYVGNEF